MASLPASSYGWAVSYCNTLATDNGELRMAEMYAQIAQEYGLQHNSKCYCKVMFRFPILYEDAYNYNFLGKEFIKINLKQTADVLDRER